MLKGSALASGQCDVFSVNITQDIQISAVQQWNSFCSASRAGDHAVRESQKNCSWKQLLEEVWSQPHWPIKSRLLRVLSNNSLNFYRDGHFILSLGLFHKFDYVYNAFFWSVTANQSSWCSNVCPLPFLLLLCSLEKEEKLHLWSTLSLDSCNTAVRQQKRYPWAFSSLAWINTSPAVSPFILHA